jgi:D-alanyl-D-alanine carboxypeptidase (penicillin-binding protein 5/6)
MRAERIKIGILSAALFIFALNVLQLPLELDSPLWIPTEGQLNYSFVPQPEKGPSNTASAAILYEAKTNTILYADNIHQKRAPASTTKIMTAILAIELGRLDDMVTVSRKAVSTPGSTAFLYHGQKVSLYNLLHGLLLNSGNDAAVAIAEHIAGSVERFAEMMNARAQEIGAVNTHFQNPHGLDDTDHYSTAYDLALITDLALKYPVFAEIVSKRQFTTDTGQTYRNTNRLLFYMSGIEGVKTGTTGKAGHCLVAASSQEGLQLISVVLDSDNRWKDTENLINYGFDAFQLIEVIPKGAALAEIPLPQGTTPLIAVAEKAVYVVIRSDVPAQFEMKVTVNSVRLPIRKDDEIGQAKVRVPSMGMEIEIPLTAKTEVWKKTPWRLFTGWIKKLLNS